MKVIHTPVSSGKRQLSKRYTMEVPQDPQVDMAREIMDALTLEIQQTIDDEIMQQIFSSQGWHRVPFTRDSDRSVTDITQWLQINCIHNHYLGIDACMFEHHADAMTFALAWGS